MPEKNDFAGFVQQSGNGGQSDIKRIFQYAGEINQYDSFEDDLTIVTVIFTT